MRDATLCLLVRGDPSQQVLLGLKRAGFGACKWGGFGGKIEPGETLAMCAARELQEEAGIQVTVEHLEPDVNDIPYHQMWQDAPYWLPRVLAGQRLSARFIFAADNETVDIVQAKRW
jgi:8-oxo-dGTP diphosphatase